MLATLDLAAVPGRPAEDGRDRIDELAERFAGAQGLDEILASLRELSANPLRAALPDGAQALRTLLLRHEHHTQPLRLA